MYQQYKINSSDRFEGDRYPNVISELKEIGRNTSRMSRTHKSDIVISFLKDHSLEIRWIDLNPKLVKFMTSRSVITTHVESLFEACRGNHLFLTGFEACIKQQLK